jgi:ferredoxin-NADP reductase
VKAKLTGKTEEGNSIKRFIFGPVQKFDYTAGQFAFFEFDEFSKPFSISNSPDRENIEITTIISGSDYKKALDSLEPRQEINIRGPFGNFTLQAMKKETVCFLCGGIGITPVKSMLEFAADEGIKINGTLFYANRNISRIVFKDELDEISQRVSGLNIVHILSDPGNGWTGEKGYINSGLIRKYRTNYKDCHFYIVGPPDFNKAMKSMVCGELNIDNEFVTLENFAGY